MSTTKQTLIRAFTVACAMLGISATMLGPAVAQFWNWGSPPRQSQQQQQQYNPFGGWFGERERRPRRQQQQRQQQQRQQRPRAPVVVDNAQAPAAARRSAESLSAVTSNVVVMGDGMADWLASGLEDALSERPEFGIVRKHRPNSGLVRYDPRRDVEWAQVAREIIATERPKFIVMMVGFHDRQPIRERTPQAAPARPATNTPPPADDPELQEPDSPEGRARASAEQQNAEMRAVQPAPAAPAEQRAATGPMEFQSEAWRAAYIRRIDATMAVLKSANVPVFWVGLPPQRNPRQSADAIFLNELYRARAERAGIIYVDIWDGFVDEAGLYVLQGPDFEGQTRRLRSADGIYFTPAGARKLAHYVEREILRSVVNQATPVALPIPEPEQPQRSGRPGRSSRPVAGPVIPLTASIGGGNELLGGGPVRPSGSDPLASRVLVRGEPITAPSGRADNFVWPRGGEATVQEPEPEPIGAPIAPPAPAKSPQQQPAAAARPSAASPQQQPAARTPIERRGRQRAVRRVPPRASNDGVPRVPPRGSNDGVSRPPARASNDGIPRPPLPVGR